jgi:SagB-type dehydrogenase family enzyme
MNSMDTEHKFLRSDGWEEWGKFETDQKKGIPAPALQKPHPADASLMELVPRQDLTVGKMPLLEAISRRVSHRKFKGEALSLEELSFLLWATQGVRKVLADGATTRRTVPSGGSRHPFETYLVVNNVDAVKPGLYRYLPLDHKLCFLGSDDDLPEKINEGCHGQKFVGTGAVIFIWTAIPYRSAWRYSFISPKIIALDVGHVCQNLYLACEAIAAGTCAIGAYDQDKMDALVGVNGRDELVVYLAPVGKV